MRLAITLGQLNPAYWEEVVVEADALGYESVWLPEHLVFPVRVDGQLVPGEEHPPVPPDVPIYDVAGMLSYLAARTERIRLGTFVYLLGIRHPFVGARAFATIDVLSGGRAEVGVGAGWLTTEWEAVGLDHRTRGARLDEAIDVCRRLWTEPTVAHRGDHFAFDEVAFAPKPVQAALPVSVGGESGRALRRAAERGDGWLGMGHTPESAAERVRRLGELRDEAGTLDRPFVATCMGSVESTDDVERFAEAGIDRLIVTPWTRSREAVDGLRRLAETPLPDQR